MSNASPTRVSDAGLRINVDRNNQSPESKFGRSPTIEEQKSLNMAESLNMRAMEADGQALEECNWYELRPAGPQPQRRAYHSTFVHNNK